MDWSNPFSADNFSWGQPGHNSFNATPAPVDPNAFKNPYLTGGANTLGSQANLEGAAGAVGPNAGYNAAQAGYGNLAGRLEATATGAPGTSIAEQKLAQATAKNNANAMGMAATTAGQNPALAARNALNVGAANNLGAASEAGVLGLQERNQANAQLGNVYGMQGGQGIAENSLENQARQNYTGMAMGAQQNQLQAQENQQGLESGNYNAAAGLNAGVAQGNAQNGANLFAGGVNALGSIIPHLASGGVTGGIGDALKAFAAGYGHIPQEKPDASSTTSMPGEKGNTNPSVMDNLSGSVGSGGSTMSAETAGAGDLGAASLTDLGPIAMLAARKGTVVPGTDHGVDTSPYLLRPNEVVTPPENPMHPYIKAAQTNPAIAAAMAHHLSKVGMTGMAAGGTVVPGPSPVPAPTPTPPPRPVNPVPRAVVPGYQIFSPTQTAQNLGVGA